MKLFAKKLGLDISSPIFSSSNISKNHGEQMKLESKMAFSFTCSFYSNTKL